MERVLAIALEEWGLPQHVKIASITNQLDTVEDWRSLRIDPDNWE
ncbi:hypothetical protein [Calothrix sp. PCC 7507]|nr:hypothetical protein [Calothrix sp. PCC 7507]AFY35619.1 hypothetical protein Cal7507_5280 [Calothrix sp. PCC 7507]